MLVLFVAAPASAAPLRALDRMMAALGPESARAAAAIRRAYEDHLDLLFLDEYAALEGSLATGGLAPLPEDPLRFNLVPRLEGAHPIGEKDLDNQGSYIAARPFTIGCLLEIASRVRSGPLEITSLVRHGEYQDELRRTNGNAATSVPTHTMGLAIDIALINTPLKTVYEIRNVLRRMRDAGDLLFIGERQQLVFHVVPHPARLGHFMDVYTRALGAPPATRVAQVLAPAPTRPRRGAATHASPLPAVTAEVVAVVPADPALDEWWQSPSERQLSAKRPERVGVTHPSPLPAGDAFFAATLIGRGGLPLIAAVVTTIVRIGRRARRAPHLV